MDMKKSLKHGVDLKNLERENLSQIAYLTISTFMTIKLKRNIRFSGAWAVGMFVSWIGFIYGTITSYQLNP